MDISIIGGLAIIVSACVLAATIITYSSIDKLNRLNSKWLVIALAILTLTIFSVVLSFNIAAIITTLH